MYNQEMYRLGSKRSNIREIFEYAKRRSAEIGAENVFDFSIGNPSVPSPPAVEQAVRRIISETPSVALHGYTSAQGDKRVRDTIAQNYARRFGVPLTGDEIYMTCGAAASLTISLKALVNEGDEILVFAPYFPEYAVFAATAGAKLVVVPSAENMQPNFQALERALNAKVKGVLINSPNNPSGAVYGKNTMRKLAEILSRKSEEHQKPVYLISDEPYRELVYGENTEASSAMQYYQDTLVCYSYSKSLSLAGERIGYIAVHPNAQNAQEVYAAICGAGRALGFVCAPALFQRVVAECDGLTADISVYERNRDLLYHALTAYGFTCIYPDGAFYLFVKSPEPSSKAFCERAKAYELLFVDGADFGAEGWVRIAYCVPTERIEKSLSLLKKLAKEYDL